MMSSTWSFRIRAVGSGFLLLLGLGCLNYSREGNRGHHREWAQGYGLPEPGPEIFYLGVGLGLLGLILLLWTLFWGRPKS